MKRIFKRTLSIFLAVIILLGSVPIAGFVGVDLLNFSEFFATKAKAIEASDLPEDFDLPLYNVSRIFSDSNNSGGSLKTFSENFINLSLAKNVYNAATEDAGFVASVEAWEAIRLVSNPANLTEHIKFQQQYEKVIFAVLFCALENEQYVELSYSKTLSKITGLTDKILSSSKKAELLDKTSLDGTEKQELIDTAFAFLTNGKDVESKWSALGEYTDIVNKYISIADDIAGGVVSAINIIDSVSMYVSMLDSGADVIEYLYDLKGKSPNSVFSAAVQTVINTISNDWLGVVEKTIMDTGFVFGEEATKKLIDYAWTGCCAMLPFLGGMTIGETIGTVACNLLFATEDTIEQYEYLKILTQLEIAACALYDTYFNSCKSSVNSENAAMLMFACDFSHALYGEATEASVEMMNILCNKGIVNTVINIFNSKYRQTFDEFEETANIRLNAEKIVYNTIKSFWKNCIEEDYPEFFTVLEEENITPKYIEEVNIEKDEAVFRVGDAMYFKWTLSPIDHEGKIGLKSDNEAVLRSSEPMGMLPLALEENVGTANVTIYSVDNPEICDSIKITVIGKDEEDTTEAAEKYVSGKCGDNVTWTLNKNTGRLVISGEGTMEDYVYYYDGISVAPWFGYDIVKVNIEQGVTSIGRCAFYTYLKRENCLKYITIPDSVTHIGSRAFDGCNKLAYINLPDSIISIGGDAFSYTSLVSITIPESVQQMGQSVFYGCGELKTVNFNAKNCRGVGVESEWPVFRVSSVSEVNIGPNVEIIHSGIFNDCYQISKITFAEDSKLSSVSAGAFSYCSGLTNIKIPAGTTSIGSGAFQYCDNLIEIDIPNSVTYIGEGAFYDTGYYNDKANWKNDVLYINNHLIKAKEDVTGHYSIQNGTKTIASAAFGECSNLTGLTIPKDVAVISEDAFRGCNGITTINYDSQDCVLTMGYSSEFDRCGSLSTVNFGESVKSIPAHAFRQCDNLSSVVFSNSITCIGNSAFEDCDGLVSITIPNTVTDICESAFYDCSNLEEITLGTGIISIGEYAFSCTNIRSIIIPQGVTNIAQRTFEYCNNLKSITIPNSITSIGNGAFVCCDNLTDVYYMGTEEEWNAITIDKWNEDLTNATIHFIYNSCKHSYIVSTTPAGCTTEGILTYTCEECGESYTETIPATGHTSGAWEITVEPTTETTGKKIKKCTVCGETVAEEIIAKLPQEPVKDNSVVKNPSTSSISYGDSIILHVDPSKIPVGGYVKWTSSNGNFSYSVSDDGATCKISPSKSGDTTFTATIYDADGNVISSDEQVMTSKAGFFQKIIAFFKKLFGLTKVIPNIIKNAF